MLSIVVYLWNGPDPRRVYRPCHVNTLRRAIARHLPQPHRFVCVADSGEGLAGDVEHLATPAEAREVGRIESPENHNTSRFPSCYRRLWGFSSQARAALGERQLVLDIDVVPVADWTPIVNRPESFVGDRPRMTWGNTTRVAGGHYLLESGAHSAVWDEFYSNPPAAIARARAAGFRGSDQAWISYCLGAGAATWPKDSGIYSIRDLKDGRLPLPGDARLVTFNGPRKPWDSELPWVREHWQ